jgi:hypothetical protein
MGESRLVGWGRRTYDAIEGNAFFRCRSVTCIKCGKQFRQTVSSQKSCITCMIKPTKTEPRVKLANDIKRIKGFVDKFEGY